MEREREREREASIFSLSDGEVCFYKDEHMQKKEEDTALLK